MNARWPRLLPLSVSVSAVLFALCAGDVRRTFKFWSPDRLLAHVPAEASLVVTVDWSELRRSPLLALMSGGEREIPGLGTLSSLCGRDPTPDIRVLAVALPPDDRRSGASSDDLGIVVGGDFDQRWIADCARRAMTRRHARPGEQRRGPFLILSADVGGSGLLAVGDGGPVLLGGEKWLGEMLQAAEGSRPSVASSEVHRSLRRVVSPAAVLLSWRSAQELAPEVSAVRGVGVGLKVRPSPGLEAVLRCPSFQRCSEVATAIERAGRRLLGNVFRRRDTPELELATHPTEVRLRLRLTPDQALDVVRAARAVIDS